MFIPGYVLERWLAGLRGGLIVMPLLLGVGCGGAGGGNTSATTMDALPKELDTPREEFDRRIHWKMKKTNPFDPEEALRDGFGNGVSLYSDLDNSLARASDKFESVMKSPEALGLVKALAIEQALVAQKMEMVLGSAVAGKPRDVPRYAPDSQATTLHADEIGSKAVSRAERAAIALEKGEIDHAWLVARTLEQQSLNRRINALAAHAHYGGPATSGELLKMSELTEAPQGYRSELKSIVSSAFLQETVRIENDAIGKSGGALSRKR
jgi:hypothetical protein